MTLKQLFFKLLHI